MAAQQLQMQSWLNTGTNEERVEKMVSLGVERETAELATGENLEWRVVRTDAQRETAILFLPCDALSSASLYLLESTSHSWHVTDVVGFDCHYDDSVSVGVTALRSPKADDVFVHHECEGRGTGFLQQNFNVFVVASSKLKLVLSTKEILKESDWPETHVLNQRSSFALTRATRDGSGGIEEKRRTEKNGKRIVETRTFRWSPKEFRFVPSPFVKVK
ncbi:MAG: hypothetical protein ACLQAT_03620 [Candidatus Binataceae bacterium]